MRLGIDDTDSPEGMCTTFLGAVLRQRLESAGCQVDESFLVRLNPNVRYKTRGNAAVSLEVSGDRDFIFQAACACVEEFADLSCENTNPGVVLVESAPDDAFYRQALREFCTTNEAIEVLDAAGGMYKGWKNRRGLIGATAAVCCLPSDETYELLAYRHPWRRGTRKVDLESIFRAEDATYPHTWDSVDRENNTVVCVPHTPDPVLFGIRGENARWVERARSFIKSEKPVYEHIYRTNQGTDAHLIPVFPGEALQGGRSYLMRGTVASTPVTRRGGHVAFTIIHGTEPFRCMAYEPTKGFRDIVRELVPGDEVVVTGSYKGESINLEKVGVSGLSDLVEMRPPHCPGCGKRMTSAGTQKGYKCRRCGRRSLNAEKATRKRRLLPGWYEVPPGARRHLAKPLLRGVPCALDRGGSPDALPAKKAGITPSGSSRDGYAE